MFPCVAKGMIYVHTHCKYWMGKPYNTTRPPYWIVKKMRILIACLYIDVISGWMSKLNTNWNRNCNMSQEYGSVKMDSPQQIVPAVVIPQYRSVKMDAPQQSVPAVVIPQLWAAMIHHLSTIINSCVTTNIDKWIDIRMRTMYMYMLMGGRLVYILTDLIGS